VDVVNLGVLGGTFDPIHLGHLKMAQAAYQAVGLDKVLFVPAGDPPHKQNLPLTPARQRVKMVSLAIADHPHFELSTVDIDRPGPHYTVDTVTRLRTAYRLSAEECFFIIGGDSFVDLPDWYKPQQLLNSCRLAVIHRPGFWPNLTKLTGLFPNLTERITWVAMPPDPVSSTNLRRLIGRGNAVDHLLPKTVWDYIQQAGLYSI